MKFFYPLKLEKTPYPMDNKLDKLNLVIRCVPNADHYINSLSELMRNKYINYYSTNNFYLVKHFIEGELNLQFDQLKSCQSLQELDVFLLDYKNVLYNESFDVPIKIELNTITMHFDRYEKFSDIIDKINILGNIDILKLKPWFVINNNPSDIVSLRMVPVSPS